MPSTDRDAEIFGQRSSDPSSSKGYSFRWWHPLLVVLIIFPYISVIVLFGLVANQKGDTTNNVSLSPPANAHTHLLL